MFIVKFIQFRVLVRIHYYYFYVLVFVDCEFSKGFTLKSFFGKDFDSDTGLQHCSKNETKIFTSNNISLLVTPKTRKICRYIR